jgi:hypothetical protein
MNKDTDVTDTVEPREALLTQCIVLMRLIIEEYGEESGEKMWDHICDALPDTVKRHLLMKMIVGNFSNRIVIRHAKMSAQKVPMIKAVREVDNRKLGLREAKDLVDKLYESPNTGSISLHVDLDNRIWAMEKLSCAGFVV